MSLIELQYRVIPPPTSDLQLQCISPNKNEDNSEDSSPIYRFQNSGVGVDKVNFEVPYSHTFFSETSVNGCPRYLNVYLLGFERCEHLFMKYADNVTRIDFFGCFNHPEICLRICAQLKNLREVRFDITGNKNLDERPQPMICVPSQNGLKCTQITSLSIVVNTIKVRSQSVQCQELINKYVEILLEYSEDKFPNLGKLNMELPDDDTILSLTRKFLRSTNLKRPCIYISLDESIKVNYDANRRSQSTLDATQTSLPKSSNIQKPVLPTPASDSVVKRNGNPQITPNSNGTGQLSSGPSSKVPRKLPIAPPSKDSQALPTAPVSNNPQALPTVPVSNNPQALPTAPASKDPPASATGPLKKDCTMSPISRSRNLSASSGNANQQQTTTTSSIPQKSTITLAPAKKAPQSKESQNDLPKTKANPTLSNVLTKASTTVPQKSPCNVPTKDVTTVPQKSPCTPSSNAPTTKAPVAPVKNNSNTPANTAPPKSQSIAPPIPTKQTAQPISSPKPAASSVYSYEMATTERLLRESAVQMDKRNAMIAERNESRAKLEEVEAKKLKSNGCLGKNECASPTSSGLPLEEAESTGNTRLQLDPISSNPSPEPHSSTMMRDDSNPPVESQEPESNGFRSRSGSIDERQGLPRYKFVNERDMERDYEDEYDDEDRYRRSRSRSRDGSRSRHFDSSPSPRYDYSPDRRRRRDESYSPDHRSYHRHPNRHFKHHSRGRRGQRIPNRYFRGHRGGSYPRGTGYDSRGYHSGSGY